MGEQNYIKTVNGKLVNFIPSSATAVTPHDTNTFQFGLLYVGVGGDVVAMPADGSAFVTFKNVPSGSFLPIYVNAVAATNTSATDMLICY